MQRPRAFILDLPAARLRADGESPSPVVALNRAIAQGEVGGPAAALALLDDLDGYHLFYAARADLLRRLGRPSDATKAYARAADLATSDAERAFLCTAAGRSRNRSV
jgi:RNA polymerase sigma-70 factor (ECF subfamily)